MSGSQKDGEGGYTDFWSRRKAAVRREQEAEAGRLEAEAEAARVVALEEKSDEEILEELGLPDPDTLTQGDDFKKFLLKTVPERLRRRALRRLWTSNPVLANLDGLNDYDEDFTDVGLAEGGVRTAYQVGRGFLDRLEERASGEPAAETVDAEGAATAEASQTGGAEVNTMQDSGATQNTYDENASPSIALTQMDYPVHSDENGAIDSEETAPVSLSETRPAGRRRIRFDYE